MLRAHQITSPALSWLLGLPAQEGLRVWLISPRPLPEVADVGDLAVIRTPAGAHASAGSDHPADCGCEDLNRPAPAEPPATAAVGLSVDIARRLRRLYDIEAAALGAAAVLLGHPDPGRGQHVRVRVAADARTVTTSPHITIPVPEYAHALLRGWAGRCLWPEEWACDVAATYLTLRLEQAERHSGVRLIAPDLPLLPPVAWHERRDPGAEQLAWLTRSQWLCRRSP